MRTVQVTCGLLAATAVLAGCTHVDTSPLGSGIPDPSNAASTQPLPAPSGHWKGLRAQCPQLTSSAAQKFGVAGAGTPTDQYATSTTVTNADCRWGSTDGQGTAANARISIWA